MQDFGVISVLILTLFFERYQAIKVEAYENFRKLVMFINGLSDP